MPSPKLKCLLLSPAGLVATLWPSWRGTSEEGGEEPKEPVALVPPWCPAAQELGTPRGAELCPSFPIKAVLGFVLTRRHLH